MIDSQSYIRVVNLLGLEEVTAKYGASFPDLLVEVGLSPDTMSNIDALISFRRYAALLELCAARTNRPHLALEVVTKAAPEFAYCGPLMLFARFEATIDDMFRTGVRYWHFHTNAFTALKLANTERGTSILRISSDAFTTPPRQFEEAVLATIVGIFRAAANKPEAVPFCVRFQHRKQQDTAVLDNYFCAPLEFSAPHTEIEFDSAFLQQKTVGGLRLFRPLATLYIEERIKRTRNFDHSSARTVALAIPSIIGSGNCNIETVAEALGTNAKQLQRKLAKEKTSFSNILEEIRERLSRQMLAETNAPVGRIAGLLDYSASASFNAAFQRWTGMAPLQYRKQEREKQGLPVEEGEE